MSEQLERAESCSPRKVAISTAPALEARTPAEYGYVSVGSLLSSGVAGSAPERGLEGLAWTGPPSVDSHNEGVGGSNPPVGSSTDAKSGLTGHSSSAATGPRVNVRWGLLVCRRQSSAATQRCEFLGFMRLWATSRARRRQLINLVLMSVAPPG